MSGDSAIIEFVDGSTCFFNAAKSPNLVWASPENFELAEGASVMVVDPRNSALVGDIATAFRPVAEFGKLFDAKR